MERKAFCPERNGVVTIFSHKISTDIYGKGQQSHAIVRSCNCEEFCSHQYECKYSSDSRGQFDPNLRDI